MLRFSSQRAAMLAASFGLGLGAWLVMRFVAPAAGSFFIAAIALAPVACCGALAFTLDNRGIERSVWIIVGCAIAVLGIGAVVRDPNAMLPLFGYGSIAIMLVGVYSLAKAARWGSTLLSPANWLICGATTALLGLYCLHYIVASQDIMFWDVMH
jgi:hypothetical protein